MGKIYEQLTEKDQSFIAQQKVFFVATATEDSTISLSPKGLDSLRVIGPNKLIWLNLTGSGNETASHLSQNKRITLMWMSFDQQPLILRVYGQAKVWHRNSNFWQENIGLFKFFKAARQLIEVDIHNVQRSCGFAVPLIDTAAICERTVLDNWAEKIDSKKLQEYWQRNNVKSIDGIASKIEQNFDPNL